MTARIHEELLDLVHAAAVLRDATHEFGRRHAADPNDHDAQQVSVAVSGVIEAFEKIHENVEEYLRQ